MPSTMPKVSQNILKSFSTLLCDREFIPFDEFVQWALYDPKIGYYQRAKKRVGKDINNDFYTSSTLGSIWGELIIESSITMLGKNIPSEFVFVEIAAEPQTSILQGLQHPFKSHQIIRLGDKIDIPEKAVVYSNEWLDAQPFKRFKYCKKQKCWVEIFVGLDNSKLVQIEGKPDQSESFPFPKISTDGYLIDWPTGSIFSLNELITKSQWNGIFMTFDYGLDINTLLNDRPEGTARAYRRHNLTNSLLTNVGDQDITCHLCWNSLQECLKKAGFEKINLTNQEAFLLKNARAKIKKIFEKSTEGLNPKMLALRELIHPAHLGHGMQALSAARFK